MFRHAAAEEICTGETWKRLEAWYKDKKLTPKKNKSIPGPRKVHAAPARRCASSGRCRPAHHLLHDYGTEYYRHEKRPTSAA